MATIRAVADVAEPWVDAGATTARHAAALARAGVARNVIGTESIAAGALPPRPRAARPQAVLSVDLRDGRLISPDPELAGRNPAAAAPFARRLERARAARDRPRPRRQRLRASAGRGAPSSRTPCPESAIYAGGGVRDDADLRALESAGAAGALVATALHEGRLTL